MRSMGTKGWFAVCLFLSAGLVPLLAQSAARAVIRPKVVIVGNFEVGADTGDEPGELQLWVEREHLDRVIPVPGAFHPVRANADGSVIALTTGAGNIHPAVSLTALGLDPEFDLRKSYWLLAGIAGISVLEGSPGSTVWTDFVVNGDLVHEIDAREMPKDWPTGHTALDKSKPYEQPRVPVGSVDDVRTWSGTAARSDKFGKVVRLNTGLMQWAYEMTKEHPLADDAKLKTFRAGFKGYPKAQAPPAVMTGGNLATEEYWHGTLMEEWAAGWVQYMTDGRGRYVTTAENDSGSVVALLAMAQAGRVDADRIMLLRAASNFDRQPPGMTAAESMFHESHGTQVGFKAGIEAAYQVGSIVVHRLVAGWAEYEGELPSK